MSRPYPEYKDYAAPWLGLVPQDWDIRKIKYLFNERVEKGYPSESLLAATQTKGVVPKSHYGTRTVTAQKDLHLLKLVRENDFVISLRSFQGGIERAYFRGIISPAYTIMIPYEIVSVGYFKHLAKSKPFIKLLTTCVTGIREGQNIDYEILKRNKLPLPSLVEQNQIARYLDCKTVQIAKFIKDKKRMIELLKEQKQVIINDAVTGKIDVITGKPYPKYKDSGVEWLGQVPDGWETIPIKRIVQFNPSRIETGLKNYSVEDVVFLPMEKVSTEGKIDCTEKKKYKDVCSGFSYFRKNDVVVAKITPCFENGKGAFLDALETEFGFGTTELITLRLSNKINGKYLRLLLSSKWFLRIAEKHMTGSAGQKRISSDFIGNFCIMLPKINVQNSLLNFFELKVNNMNVLISRTEREIGLMQEYRDRLIADVVTGKLDVRDIVVPELLEELSADDDGADEEPDEIENEVEV